MINEMGSYRDIRGQSSFLSSCDRALVILTNDPFRPYTGQSGQQLFKICSAEILGSQHFKNATAKRYVAFRKSNDVIEIESLVLVEESKRLQEFLHCYGPLIEILG